MNRTRVAHVMGATIALILLTLAAACGGDGESRLDQGLNAADQAIEQGQAVEQHQRAVEDAAELTP